MIPTLPETWNIRRIMKEFNASCPQSLETKENLMNASSKAREKNSRSMSDTKICIAVQNNNGKEVTIPKRQVFCNLREVYILFKKFPEINIYFFFLFAELRPTNVVLAGANGIQ